MTQKNEFVVFHLDDGKELRGGQRQAIYLARELGKMGIENYIACRKNSPLEKAAKKENIKTVNLPYVFEWDVLSAFKLAKKIKKNGKTPILHSHTSHTAAISYLTSLLCRVIRIVHRRVDFKVKKSLSSKLKYENADMIIALSEKIKSAMPDIRTLKEIKIIPSALDLKSLPWKDGNLSEYKTTSRKKILKRFSIPENSFIVGSLIALDPHKDPLNLVQAAKIVLNKFPEIHFILAGEGKLKKRISTLTKKLGIEKNFHTIGYCAQSYELLAALDIFVLPSKEEGLGSVLLEAMAVGLPIVATNAGGIPELIQDDKNGLIAEKENSKKLAAALTRLIENKDLRKRLSKKAKEEISNHKSGKMAKETLKIYEKAIENFKPR